MARRRNKVVSLDAFRARRRAEEASLATFMAEKLTEMQASPPPLRGASIEDVINLGTSLSERGDHAGARYAFRLALALEPTSALAMFNLGTALDDAGDFNEALATYEATLRLDPTFADAHYNLSVIYGKQPGSLWRQKEIRHLNEYRKLTRKAGQ